MSLNLVVVKGNLTRDPELKRTGSGKAVVNATLAVNGRSYKKDDQWVNDVVFIDIEAWDTGAERIGEMKKGECLIVRGSLKQQTWEQDGAKRSKIVVRCDEFEKLNLAKRESGGQTNETSEVKETVGAAAGSGDDIPF